MTKFYAVISAKGGVGKTTTTINLASALHILGRQVIAIDADLTAPNMSIHLGLPNLPRTIHDALDGKIPLSKCIYYHPSGLHLIPGSLSYETTKAINHANFGPMLQELHGKAEIVLIDGAPGVSQEATMLIQAVDYVIPVTTPDVAAISDARKTIKMATEQNKTVLGIIVNRIRGEEHEIDVANIEAFLEAPVIGVIPEEESVRAAYQLKHPVPYTHPDGEITIAYKKIAARLLGEEYHPSLPKKGSSSLTKDILHGWKIV